MKYKIVVSPLALNMLDDILKFIAISNYKKADETRKKIIQGIRQITVFPYKHPVLFFKDYLKNNYRKVVVDNKYLVIYQVIKNTIYVEYIVDCKQENKWLFK